MDFQKPPAHCFRVAKSIKKPERREKNCETKLKYHFSFLIFKRFLFYNDYVVHTKPHCNKVQVRSYSAQLQELE